MSHHEKIKDLLPLYASGGLDPAQQRNVEAHLLQCADCRADLQLWQAVAGEVTTDLRMIEPPRDLAERALRYTPRRRQTSILKRTWLLLHSQLPLVRREIWPASAAVMALGFIVVVLGIKVNMVELVAPLVATAGLAIIYGPAHDIAHELARSSPTSPRQILLARLALVFSYNFVLALVASLLALPFLPGLVFDGLVMGWLGPMAFLSSAALVLSLLIGSDNAVSITYLAWLVKVFGEAGQADTAQHWFQPMLNVYAGFWANSVILLLLAAVLMILALWLAGRPESRSLHRV
jgi:hypothetical protein